MMVSANRTTPKAGVRPTGNRTPGTAFALVMGGIADSGPSAWRRQNRLNTSVPLVPPKPKLFFTATSIFMSRAELAQ